MNAALLPTLIGVYTHVATTKRCAVGVASTEDVKMPKMCQILVGIAYGVQLLILLALATFFSPIILVAWGWSKIEECAERAEFDAKAHK